MSKNGGVEIEEVAKTDPDSIIVQSIEVDKGLEDKNLDIIVDKLDLQSVRE